MLSGMEHTGGEGQLSGRVISCPRTCASSEPAAACLGLGWASGSDQHSPSQAGNLTARFSALGSTASSTTSSGSRSNYAPTLNEH